MDLIVDTSAIMAVVLNEASKAALVRMTRGRELGSAPSLPWEVGNALSALLRRGTIDEAQARKALASFRRIPLRLLDVSLEDALAMSADRGIYAYDAYMLVCARQFRTPFLSLDQRQIGTAREIGIEVLEV